MAVNLKTATPDTTLPTAGFLFGADSQSASAPSVYPLSALAQTLLGSTAFSGDTVTASKPLLDMAQTWNNAAVTFTADKINVTKMAANAASLIFDRQVDGVSKAKIDVTGLLTIGCVQLAAIAGTATVTGPGNAGYLEFNAANGVTGFGDKAGFSNGSGGLGTGWFLSNDAVLGWSPTANAGGAAPNLTLAKDAADVLALRRGANAQAFNIYNTYTDASNYERAGVIWSSNVAYLRTQNAGTGSARLLIYQSGSTAVASLPSAATAGAGAHAFVTDATQTLTAGIGAVVAGGGANKVPVVSDGTNWLIG